jgi:hypothetical protein
MSIDKLPGAALPHTPPNESLYKGVEMDVERSQDFEIAATLLAFGGRT